MSSITPRGKEGSEEFKIACARVDCIGAALDDLIRGTLSTPLKLVNNVAQHGTNYSTFRRIALTSQILHMGCL